MIANARSLRRVSVVGATLILAMTLTGEVTARATRSASGAIPDAGATASPSKQAIPTGVSRIGGLQSRTAHIDGVDQRVDADVAILDTGIQTDHPDLNVVGGVNCSADPGGSFGDLHGHGTRVAGAVGAIDNNFGIVGAAPGVRLWSVKVLDQNDSGDLSNIVCGVEWVIAHADTIDVAVMGFGDFGTDDGACGYSIGDLFHQAICRAVAAGVTMVAAAGNLAIDASGIIPAAYPEVLTVSWYSDLDGLPGALSPKLCDHYSSDDALDPDSDFGAPVDIAAPGDCIRTTLLNGKYGSVSSNSLSSGYVGAAAALYLAKHRGASPVVVKNALLGLAEPGPLQGDPDGFHEGLLDISRL